MQKSVKGKFPGFRSEYKRDFFKYPTTLEQYWPQLTGNEHKVLTYILRRTFGFSKVEDKISLSQFAVGAGKNNKGVGISRSTAKRCLESLEKQGFITLEKRGFRTTTVRLKLLPQEESDGQEAVAVVTASLEIGRLIELFRPIAGHQTNSYKNSKKQVSALERLIEYYGAEQVEKAITAAVGIQGLPYMPVITSPMDLERKLPQLMSAMKRRREETRNHNIL